MHLIHPSAIVETSDSMMTEFMKIIENAGRTCWKSERQRHEKALKYMLDPEFQPQSYESHQAIHCRPQPLTVERLMSPGFVRISREDEAYRQVTTDFIKHLTKIGHLSVLEHGCITVRIITDRAVTHQLVRHRIGSYSQESQRYVGQKGHVTFIIPEGSGLEPGYYRWDDGWHSGMEGEYKTRQSLSEILMETLRPNGFVQASLMDISSWPEQGMPRSWIRAMHYAEKSYHDLLGSGIKKEDARSVLPNATKTEIVATYNLSQWRHVLKTRLHPSAQHDIRKIMGMILEQFMSSPVAPLFEDILKCVTMKKMMELSSK